MKKLLLFILLLTTILVDAQEDKTVTLTVSGTGKTLEEAKTNALRSAIEQAFGTFISSKTEILNDNLVKDEIVSVANGNVQKYDIVSQVEVPDIGYAITLSATVSILRLTSFAESKGVEVEFKGGMFAQNIKLQKLNEQSEEKAIKNLIEVYTQLLESSFDYKLITSEPFLVKGQSDLYNINFSIKTVENDNYIKFINYFKETLGKVQAIEDEAANIIKVGKPIYYLVVDDRVYKFRTINSFHYIEKFFICSQLIATSFKITSNLATYKYNFKDIYNNKNLLLNNRLNSLRSYDKDKSDDKIIHQSKRPYTEDKYLSDLYPFFIENNSPYKSLTDLYSVEIFSTIDEKSLDKKFKHYFDKNLGNAIDINNFYSLYFNTHFNEPTYSYNINLNLNELEKVTSFKIEKVPFLEYINNLDNFVVNPRLTSTKETTRKEGFITKKSW
jgi:hypothetical protein